MAVLTGENKIYDGNKRIRNPRTPEDENNFGKGRSSSSFRLLHAEGSGIGLLRTERKQGR